jgi:hypothetical protein
MDPKDTSTPQPGQGPEQQALQLALAGLLSQVARLGVGKGLPYAQVEEMLRRAFVQAASQAHPGLPEHRKVSRISTTTGINRREVTRLVQALAQPEATAARPRSLATEAFAHWRTQPVYRDGKGQPRPLPRLGPEPSFETLAQAITRDVHPRSLLDELVRLGLVHWEETSDLVQLARETFVASGDSARQLGFLGDNVGDHLRAAVDNVLGGNDRLHFEQALFADGLSLPSIESVRPTVRAQWQQLLTTLVPALEVCVQQDAQHQPAPQGRLRVGLYTYHEGAQAALEQPASKAPRAAQRARAPRKT